MSDLKKRLRCDWQFILVAITTSVAGLNFLVHPGLLEDKSTYAFIMNVLDDAVFSVPILVSGIIGIILFLLNKKQYRAFLLVTYQFFWMILFLAYAWRAISGYPNSSWVMALCINIAIFLLALWGETNG